VHLASLCDWSTHGPWRAAPGDCEIDALIARGVTILKGMFREAIAKENADRTHVLPLSGGLDSRALLGGLLESVESTQIQAVTYGTPGTWDYELGQHVARAAGVRCQAIDLTSSDWKWDTSGLVDTATGVARTVCVFDAYVNRWIAQRFSNACVYWSGFMGEALSGAHLPSHASASWSAAISHFVLWNRLTRSLNLAPSDFRPEEYLPCVPFLGHHIIPYDDQLDLGIRQECYIRPIVVQKGRDFRTPFLDRDWLSFTLHVPHCCRQGQHLYKEILKTAYPKLFSLPTKNSFGLPLSAPRWRRSLRRQGLRLRAAARRSFPWVDWRTSPNTNYIDFDRGLRERADLKTVVYESIQDLKKRRIVDWINIDAIWNRHQNRQANHADALTLLASLEINLKARELRPT